MSGQRVFSIAILWTGILLLAASQSAQAQLGICLNRTPAPPAAILNDGSGSITFNWTISTGATCSTAKLEVINPSDSVVFTTTVPCTSLNSSYNWTVPARSDCGCYYGRVTYYSNWCASAGGRYEDQATVGFIVSAAAKLIVCKRWDLNGDGNISGDPPLADWEIFIERPFGQEVAHGFTDLNGCATFTIDVDCVGQSTAYVREVLQPGWQKTTPFGATNPYPIALSSGATVTTAIGNWQPVIITGYKHIDNAPWPWTFSQWVGTNGQQNPLGWEPVPKCSDQPPLPGACLSPFDLQVLPEPNVVVKLYDNTNELSPVWLATTQTNASGLFTFGPFQWRQKFKIVIPPTTDTGGPNPPPSPPSCDTHPADGGLSAWPGAYIATVATTVWSPGSPRCQAKFTDPHNLPINVPEPVASAPPQEYGCNYFYNRQPSRLWGLFCTQAMTRFSNIELITTKDGYPYPPTDQPRPSPSPSGFYDIPSLSVPGEATGGLRSGIYTLKPSPVLDPIVEYWEVTTYCVPGYPDGTPFEMPSDGVIADVGHSTDSRVDFCISQRNNQRICFLPVTFTQQGWHDFCDPANPIITNGMIYNRFPLAFRRFKYYGTVYPNKVIIGVGKTITFDGTSGSLERLCMFLPQTTGCGKLDRNYVNPSSTSAGALAGELLALQLNIAYNDERQMPRTYGYDFEQFKLLGGLFKGKTVGEVRNLANAVLGGTPPCGIGLPGPNGCQNLVDILAAINKNYQFINFDIFIDRGYLDPRVPLGPAQPPIQPTVPYP